MFSRHSRAFYGLLLSLAVFFQLPTLAQKQTKRATLAPVQTPMRAKRAPRKVVKPQATWLTARKASKGAKATKTFALAPDSTSCPTKTPISPGQTINGTLATSDCPLGDGSFYDEYTFNATAGQQVSVAMSSTAFDTYLFLLKPSETTVSASTIQNDDNCNPGDPNCPTDSRIPAVSGTITLPETGQYSILANSFSAGETGAYSVTLNFGGAGMVCPPNPTPISNGQTVNGTLDANDCKLTSDNSSYDAYSFTANAGQQVSITMTSAAFDAFLELIPPGGSIANEDFMATDDNSAGGTNAHIPPGTTNGFAVLPASGTYIILANSALAGQTGNYSLTLNIAATNCPSTQINVGQTVNGTLDNTDCRLPADGSFLDQYTFNGTQGQQIAISMTATAPAGVDPFLFLLSPPGVDIIDDDNSGGGTAARIPGPTGFFTLPVTGTYTIYANSALPNQTGGYALSLLPPQPQAGQVVISELRFDGPDSGAPSVTDDFVEIQNVTATTIDISGCKIRIANLPGSPGQDVVIPNGTLLLPGQHFLATNTGNPQSYSLNGYATGDANFSVPVAGGAAFTLPDNTIIDQVGRAGFSSPYGEGTQLPPLGGFQTQNGYVRKLNSGMPQDTNNNINDFVVVAVDPSLMTGATLGAPGPENMQSPIQRNATIKAAQIDNCADTGTATPVGGCQNRVRLLTPDPLNPTLSPNGQLLIRRRFTNQTGAAVTRLRFRIVDVTTNPAPAGQADLRALSSQDITVVRGDGGGTVDVRGLTLEQPPNQPNGGGINSSLALGTVTMGTPLAQGASVAVEFRLGIVQGGSFRFFVNVEALP
jgi:Lamin Tail Domain